MASSKLGGAPLLLGGTDLGQATGTGKIVRQNSPTILASLVLGGAQLAVSAINGVAPGPTDHIELLGTEVTAAEIAAMVATLQPPVTFTAAGGETSHTFVGLSSSHRYVLAFKLAAGNSQDLKLQPDGVDAGSAVLEGQLTGDGYVKQSAPVPGSVLCLTVATIGVARISPRFAGRVLVDSIQTAEDAAVLPLDSVWRRISKFSTDYTSLKLQMTGPNTFTAGDVLELWDCGVSR